MAQSLSKLQQVEVQLAQVAANVTTLQEHQQQAVQRAAAIEQINAQLSRTVLKQEKKLDQKLAAEATRP